MSATRQRSRVAPFAAAVVIGSQGGLNAFRKILAGLPPGFPAGIVFDLHRVDRGVTEALLARGSDLPVRSATSGLSVAPGTVVVAPADRQVLFTSDRLVQVMSPDGGVGHRFADPLLRSAADVFGAEVIAIVLSGRLAGGAEGVREVKRRGGRVLVQDPRTAKAPSMPCAALATGCVDFVLEPEAIASALTALCAAPGAADLFRVRMNAAVRR